MDGLPIRAVGEWAYEKIYRLVQYVGIFAGGMKNRWSALNYVEIGSGPGRCIVREDCTEMDGTALAVVRNRHASHLDRAIFIDASQRVVEILNSRISALGLEGMAKASVGDYGDTKALQPILGALAKRSLNLVFIDPTECDVPFSTIEQVVKQLGNVDLLINVALGTDANRNIISAVLATSHAKAKEKYERFLGAPGFCSKPDVVSMATRGDNEGLRKAFAAAYLESLKRLGYVHTDIRAVRHYYNLLFASRNPRGLDFWLKSCKIAPDNQRELL